MTLAATSGQGHAVVEVLSQRAPAQARWSGKRGCRRGGSYDAGTERNPALCHGVSFIAAQMGLRGYGTSCRWNLKGALYILGVE
jgi:hypothetical protein